MVLLKLQKVSFLGCTLDGKNHYLSSARNKAQVWEVTYWNVKTNSDKNNAFRSETILITFLCAREGVSTINDP